MTNEEAIKELDSLKMYFHAQKFALIGEERFEALDLAIKALEQQPRDNNWKFYYDHGYAQAKRDLRCKCKWIPVSERLPEENGIYLATCDGEICGENEPFTSLAEYENGKWVDDEEDYQCVLAWMPLPQPYNAESEDKE